MSNLYRGSSIDASYHVSYHLAKRFQRKSCFKNLPIRNKNCLWRDNSNIYFTHEWPFKLQFKSTCTYSIIVLYNNHHLQVQCLDTRAIKSLFLQCISFDTLLRLVTLDSFVLDAEWVLYNFQMQCNGKSLACEKQVCHWGKFPNVLVITTLSSVVLLTKILHPEQKNQELLV
jgi:hypothetical protein